MRMRNLIELFVSNSKAKCSAFNGWFESVRLTFIQLDTPLTNFQYFIWLRFITSKDLYSFPLIIASDALLRPLQVLNKTFASFVNPLLSKIPSTRNLCI